MIYGAQDPGDTWCMEMWLYPPHLKMSLHFLWNIDIFLSSDWIYCPIVPAEKNDLFKNRCCYAVWKHWFSESNVVEIV